MRTLTACCQPSDSESAQNMAACLTRSRSWVRRDGGGDGGCRREGGDGAGACGVAGSHDGDRAACLRPAVPELRRTETIVGGTVVCRRPLRDARGPPCCQQRNPGLLTCRSHGVPSSVRAPQSAIPGVSARLTSLAIGRLGLTRVHPHLITLAYCAYIPLGRPGADESHELAPKIGSEPVHKRCGRDRTGEVGSKHPNRSEFTGDEQIEVFPSSHLRQAGFHGRHSAADKPPVWRRQAMR